MAERKNKRDASHVLVGERERTLASAIRRRAASIQFLDRAFEEVGCSCTPHRSQLSELEIQYKAEKERLIQELDSSKLAVEIGELKKTIFEIDLRDHPLLDRDARQAYPFLALWMLDQVREGNPDIVALDNEEIAYSYAGAWYGGWRPKSLYGVRTLEEKSYHRISSGVPGQ